MTQKPKYSILGGTRTLREKLHPLSALYQSSPSNVPQVNTPAVSAASQALPRQQNFKNKAKKIKPPAQQIRLKRNSISSQSHLARKVLPSH